MHSGTVHSRQPSAQRGMALAPGGNRNANNMPVDSDGREWSHGLCGCCSEVGTCFCATLFPCVVYGKNHERYNHLAHHGTPERDPSCANTACISHGILSLCGFSFLFQMINRGHVRERYNIKGSTCGDCCSAFWCAPCQLVQESREIELEEQSFGTH